MKKLLILGLLAALLPSCGNQLVVDSTGRVTSFPTSLIDLCQIEVDRQIRGLEASLATLETLREIGVSRSEALMGSIELFMDICGAACGPGCSGFCLDYIIYANECSRALVTEVYGP